MAYSTSNQPKLLVGSFAGPGNGIWTYTSADVAATVDNANYITDGGHLGMKVGDVVIVNDTATPATSIHRVTSVSATYPGAVDLSNTLANATSNTD